MNRILHDNLKLFGHHEFKDVNQEKAVQTVFEGNHDVFINMPSGYGKSLCYQLPVASTENKFAIVVSRTLANIKKEVKYLKSKNICAYSWDNYTPKNSIQSLQRKMTIENSNIQFLYVTAKLCEFQYFQIFLSKIRKNRLHCIVVDEAHCVSSRSHDFVVSYFKLNKLRQTFPDTPIVALTSTATEKVKRDIFKVLNMKNPLVFFVPEFRPNLYYDIEFKDLLLKQNVDPQSHLKNFITKILDKKSDSQPKEIRNCGIIFCQEHDTSTKLCQYLISEGISAAYLNKKSKIQHRFEFIRLWNSGEVNVIIASSSFGIGIDKPTVRFVVHWGIPTSIGSYYQESGRSGHDGKSSFCRIYVNTKEEFADSKCNEVYNKESHVFDCVQLKNHMKKKRQLYKKFKSSLISLKHANFAEYFGNSSLKLCKNRCDVCSNKVQVQNKISDYRSLIGKEPLPDRETENKTAKLPSSSQNSLVDKFDRLRFPAVDTSNKQSKKNISSKINESEIMNIGHSFSRASLAEEKILKKRKLASNIDNKDNDIIILDRKNKNCSSTSRYKDTIKNIDVSHLLSSQMQILAKLKKMNVSHLLSSQMQILAKLKSICYTRKINVSVAADLDHENDSDATYFEENMNDRNTDFEVTDYNEIINISSESSVIIIDDEEPDVIQKSNSDDSVIIID